MAFIVTPGQLKRRAELYYQLGSMISAGVPLIKSLEMASTNPTISISRKTIFGLIQCLQEGMTFSQSMDKVQGWMPEFDIALLSAGEKTGRLDRTFKLLSVYYESRAKIIRDTISALATTLVTLHIFLLVFPLGPLVACAQGFVSGDYSLCIPFLVQKFLIFGCLYGAVFLLIFSCQGRRGEHWRGMVESAFQLVPILRMAQKYLSLSRLAAALEALVSAGVSIVSGWQLAAASSGSVRLRRQIAKWGPFLESGTTPGEMINKTSYFPETFGNLYNTAEVSGKLDETLGRLHSYYQEEGFRTLRFFTRMMNGTIYSGIVVLVAYNVIRFWLNYYGAMLNTF